MRQVSERAVRIDISLTPLELTSASTGLRSRIAIVVDVIRATTTLALLFDRGCRRVLLAPDIQAAREAKVSRPDALLAGELGGAAPVGFDLGNSPSEIGELDLQGREVIFATTNGTRALRACAMAGATFAGSLRNATAVSRAALASLETPESHMSGIGAMTGAVPEATPSEASLDDGAWDILVVCSGRGERPAYDDTICAGYLCQRMVVLAREMGLTPRMGEGARVAVAAWRDAHASGPLRHALAQSDAAQAIAAIGLSGDLDWCVAVDASPSAPWVTQHEEPGLLVVELWTGSERRTTAGTTSAR